MTRFTKVFTKFFLKMANENSKRQDLNPPNRVADAKSAPKDLPMLSEAIVLALLDSHKPKCDAFLTFHEKLSYLSLLRANCTLFTLAPTQKTRLNPFKSGKNSHQSIRSLFVIFPPCNRLAYQCSAFNLFLLRN